MSQASLAPDDGGLDEVAILAQHLGSENAVIQCGAARALGALANSKAAQALVDVLLDEDPDVRSDAMEALAVCARPKDAVAIRRSLMGDPTKEVKIAAIRALARLQNTASLPLLRDLALDRTEHSVSWEDCAGMWDDWLDVQIAAINALGDMDDSEAVPILLAACQNEMGQDLEDIAFQALGKIADGGLTALLGRLRDPNEKTRRTALKILLESRRSILKPMADLLAKDSSPKLRALSLRCMASDDPALETLSSDSDPTVRRAVLRGFGDSRPELCVAGLSDEDALVKATALRLVAAQMDPPADLIANATMWLQSTRLAELALACIEALQVLDARVALPVLEDLIFDGERAVEVRVAALRALAGLSDDTVVEVLQRAVCGPVQQLRIAGLTSLSSLCGSENAASKQAETILVDTINGDAVIGIQASQVETEPGQDASTPRTESTGRPDIMITRDGDIVSDDGSDDTDVIAPDFPNSTLAAIQTDLPNIEPPKAARSKRKRVAIDGPDDYATDLRIKAIGAAALAQSNQVTAAISKAAEDPDTMVRAAAFTALYKRVVRDIPVGEIKPLLVSGLTRSEASIRADCLNALASMEDAAGVNPDAVCKDTDPFVRVAALRLFAKYEPNLGLNMMGDSSLVVSRVATDMVLSSENPDQVVEALKIALGEGNVEIVAQVLSSSEQGRQKALALLSEDQCPSRDRILILSALATETPQISKPWEV